MVRSIVIVGGGSAGWMAAAFLAKNLPDVEVTLIESSHVPTIGVGESTVPPIVDFMAGLDLSEAEWMPGCDATYKSAIGFKDFHRLGEPEMWYPFEPIEIFKGRPLGRYWLHKHLTDPDFEDRFTYYDYCHFVPALCLAGRTIAGFPDTRYAYHVDAGLLGERLKTVATGLGVIHVVDTITAIQPWVAADHGTGTDDPRGPGDIGAVALASGGVATGDLFIDCTGFRALLIGDHLGEPFDDYRPYLFNDRAVALSVPYDDKGTEMVSYTMCTAQSSGWVWEIPLYGRIGTGYVYSSRHLTDDAAETEIRRFLGEQRTAAAEADHIGIRTGKHRRTWVGNCVALGLAAGFIEPLESTGLQTVQGALDVLMRTLRAKGGYTAGDVAVYNRSVTKLFESIRDFLVAHYALSSRLDTPYWRDVGRETAVPESLAEKLELARAKMADREVLHRFDDAGLAGFYFEDGWQNILVGMNHLPFAYEHLEANQAGPYDPRVVANLAEADEHYERIRDNKARIGELPTHYEWLRTKIYGGRP